VAQQDCDIVHAHSTFAGIAARLVLGLRRKRPKLVYCAHGWAFDRAAPRLQLQVARWLELALSPLTDRIVCISAHDLRSAKSAGLPGNRLLLLTNGIAAALRTPVDTDVWPAGKIRVLFVGRFDRQKGADIFSDMMAELGDRWYGCAIGAPVIDGAQPEFPSNVTCVGWLSRPEVQRYLADCDVLVVPSRWEGFGLIAVEAMRAGKAVIAARVGGLADIVVDGTTGKLVPPYSAPDFAAALRPLTRQDLVAMGAAGRALFLREYTADGLNRGLFALYEGLLRSRFTRMQTEP
jgi:glycosyltransferase involved in cell wall biosynthesis